MKEIDEIIAAMCDAHERGDVEAVRNILKKRAGIEHMDEDGTWLHRAAEAGQIELVDFWLEYGWDVNCNMPGHSKRDGLLTPLHLAKNAAMTKHLLSRGAGIDAWNRFSGTPLHQAVISCLDESQKGRKRLTAKSAADQIRVLISAGADLSRTDGEGRTPLGLAIQLRRRLAEEVLRLAGAPERIRRPRAQRKKTPLLNLQRDFAKLYSYVAKRVRNFDSSNHKGLGGPGTVKLIVLGFEFAQSGWVVLVFDTRPNAEPDGEWTGQIEGNELNMPYWQKVSDALLEQRVDIILPDGSKSVLAAGSELEVPLGEMLKALLLKLRADEVFAPLPKAPRCELRVENFDGYYIWPSGKARGQMHLA
jgi:hypothetical protein